jgi:hypothetical protein
MAMETALNKTWTTELSPSRVATILDALMEIRLARKTLADLETGLYSGMTDEREDVPEDADLLADLEDGARQLRKLLQAVA